MSPQTFQYEWLVIALIYNHKYYDDLHFEAFPNDKTYITMEVQRNHLFQVFKDTLYDQKLKLVIIENKLSFVQKDDKTFIQQEIKGYEKIDATDLVPLHLDDIQDAETMTDGKQLGLFLQPIIQKQFRAQRQMVITFGHGAILGINLATRPSSLQTGKKEKVTAADTVSTQCKAAEPLFVKQKELAYVNQKLADKMNRYLHWQVFEGARDDEDKITEQEFTDIMKEAAKLVILTNKELNVALQTAIPGKKLDLLVMYNCLMQNVYAQYELSDSVNYLVAPASGISHPGYNYKDVFEKLSGNVDLSAETAADLFISTLSDQGSAFYQTYTSTLEGTWKICRMKLDKVAMTTIRSCFAALVKEMTRLNEEGPDMFIYLNLVLRQCFNYTTHCINNDQKLLDLLNFSTYLAEIAGKPDSTIQSIVPFAESLAATLKAQSSRAFVSRNFFNVEGFFADEKYNTDHGFGFLLQTQLYPPKTIQHDALSELDKDFFPAFLEDTGFIDFYKQYSAFN